MKKVDFVFLSQEEVISVGLTMSEAIDTIEAVFREHGAKRVENPPKPGIHPVSNAFIHAMPGYLPELKAAGMKWVSSFPSNAKHDLPAVMGLLALNDVETGKPIALMDCRWITGVRTGAVSGVAAKYLARKDSATVGIVGAGTQGRYNLLALRETLPALRLVKVYDLYPQAVDNFIEQVGKLVPFEIQPAASPQTAIEGSDVIVTATGKLEKPIFMERWVKEGALVLPVHHRGWENAILQKAEKFVCDDWAQLQNAHREVGGFDGPLPPLHAELGEIVLGKKPGRQSAAERIVDMNYGLAIEDVAMAKKIFEKASQKGLGQVLTLSQGDMALM